MPTHGSPHPTRPPMPHSSGGEGDVREGKMRELLATLERGVAGVLTDEGFANYLRGMARFHIYSPNNVLLILVQRPDATRVAGYRTWQSLGRQVRKGERGIRIVVPRRARVAPEDEHEDDRSIIVGFRGGTVFDIAQTDGKPLAAIPINDALTGDATIADVVREEVTRWLRGQGVTLVRADTGRANGYYLPSTREIGVHRALTGLREVKTLLHEAAHHAAAHTRGGAWADAETLAEGAAYVTLAHFGLDTSGYSFGYVAGWAQDMGVFRRNVAAIQVTARTLIAAIEGTDAEQVTREAA